MIQNRWDISLDGDMLLQGNQKHPLKRVETEIVHFVHAEIKARGTSIAFAKHDTNPDAHLELVEVISAIENHKKARANDPILNLNRRVDGFGKYCSQLDEKLEKFGAVYESLIDDYNTMVDSSGVVYKELMETQQQIRELKENGVGTGGGVTRIEIKRPNGTVREIEGLTHYALPKVIKLVSMRQPVCLVGPSGTGKSTGARQAAEACALDFTIFRGHKHATADDLFGFRNMKGEYVPGVAYEPFKKGGMLFIDEGDVPTSSFVKGMNNLTDDSPVVEFAGEQVKRHPDFTVVIAANTVGQGGDMLYTGASGALDASSLDRLMMVNWGVDLDLEYAIGLQYIPEGSAFEAVYSDWIALVRKVRAWVNEQMLPISVSPRATEKGAQLITAGFNHNEVLSLVIRNRMSPDQQEMLDDLLTEPTPAS